MADPLHRFPPILSLVFAKTGGKNIFDAWIKDVGYSDNKSEIGIRIIKGIDKKHPYWYRVIIGQLGFPNKNVKNPQIIAMPARCHTMQPSNDVNLKMFEKELKFAKTFSLCPSYMSNSKGQPQVYDELMIKKKLESILICNAFDLKKDDWLSFCGILLTDDPIIPVGKENAPILKMIERKNSFIK